MMSRMMSGMAAAAVVALSLGCASAAPAPAGSPPVTEPSRPYPVDRSEMVAVDRTTRPLPGPPPELSLPEAVLLTLPNGLEVVVFEKRDIPLVQVNLLVNAGSVRDPAGHAGLAALTADMLDEGLDIINQVLGGST